MNAGACPVKHEGAAGRGMTMGARERDPVGHRAGRGGFTEIGKQVISGAMSDRTPQVLAPEAGRWTEVGATLSLAGPMIMTMVAIIVMETVDTLMIGRLGEVALASAALAVQSLLLFLLFGLGLLSMVSSLVSQAVATGDGRSVRRSARQGLWAGLVMGAPFALLLWQARPVLLALGQDPVVVAGAQAYLDWAGPCLIPIFLTIPLRLTMAAYGVTVPSMLINWAGVPLNVLFNWTFMFGGLGGPEMGLAGAGASSLLVDALILAAHAVYILRAPPFARLALLARFWRPDWPRFRRLLTIGMPAGIALVLEHGLFAMTTLMMGWLGTAQLAAHQIAFQIVSITYMLPLGLSQAATIRVGLGAGARDLPAVRARGWTVFQIACAAMVLAAILFWTLGSELSGLFIAADDPNRADLIGYATLFLAIAAVFEIADGIQVAGGGVLRGLNDTMAPMAMALVGYWILGVPAAYVMAFALDLGGTGIWYGMAVGLSFCAAGIVGRFWVLTRGGGSAFARIAAAE